MMKTLLPCLLLLCAGSQAAVLGTENCRVSIPAGAEVPSETAIWNGPCVAGFAEGNGVLTRYVDGKQIGSFQGRMAQGMFAEGYEKLPNGDQYQGQYVQGLREGKGEWVGKYRDNYAGEWRAGERSGWGVANYALGGRYEGPWSGDQPDGKGNIIYAGGKRSAQDVTFPRQPPAPPAARTYKLRDANKDVMPGNFFPMPLALNSEVPYDKSYNELTPEQQQSVRRHYALLHPDDTPPYPEHGNAAIFRWVSQAHQAVVAEGEFAAQVDIDAEGKATSVRVLQTPDAELAKFISAVLMQQKYTPALCAGEPCAMRYPFSVKFTMK